MGKIHRKIVAAGVCCLMTGMLTGCGSDTTKITEGMQLVETLDYQGALNAFDEAEAQKEDSRLIARGRGIASMGLTEYDQAVEYFTQALELSDGWVQNVDYDMNYYLAAAYTKNGQPAEAKKVYDAILGLKPEEKDAYFLRGSAELELGDYESAKADFDQAISMDPKNYDRLIEIYEALAAHGYREVGQEYLQNVLDTAKQLDAYDSGRIYYYLGEYQKAYLALDEARDKGGADSYLYLGRAYAATGDYNYASSVYNNYLSKQGPNAEIYNELGLCEMAKKEYQNALAAFQAGKQIDRVIQRARSEVILIQRAHFSAAVAFERNHPAERAGERVRRPIGKLRCGECEHAFKGCGGVFFRRNGFILLRKRKRLRALRVVFLHAQENLVEQIALVFEMPVHCALRKPERAGNIADRDGFVAVLRKKAQRGQQDVFAGIEHDCLQIEIYIKIILRKR